MKPRRLVLGALPFLGLALTLYILGRLVNLTAALSALASAQWDWAAAAIFMTLLAPVIVAVKLWFVLKIIDYPASVARCWSAVLAAVTLNAVLPGRGGDLVRAAFLAEGPGTLGLLVGAVMLERFVDVFTLGLSSLLASIGGDAGVVPWIATLACAAAVGAVGVMSLGHKLPFKADLAERVGRSARQMFRKPGLALALVLVSLASWVNNVVVMGFCLRAVGAELPVVAVARATPIAILAGILPVSVSGIGTRDTALLLLLSDYGQQTQVVAGAFGYTVLTSWFLAAFGLAALGRETLRRVRSRADSARAEAARAEAAPGDSPIGDSGTSPESR